MDWIFHQMYQWSYDGRSKSSRPDLDMFRIKLKYYLLLIAARLRTRHAQYDFWAMNNLCKVEKEELRSVMKWQFWLIRSLHCMLCCSDSFHNSLFRMKRGCTTSILSQNELRNQYCWVTSVSFEMFFRILCTVLVLASRHPSDRHFIHTLKCTKYL